MLKRFTLGVFFLLFLSGLMLLASSAFAQSPAFTEHQADLPIDIVADDYDIRVEHNLAIFRGKVEVRQGSLLLLADTLTVYYKEHAGEGEPPIGRIDAAGNVKMSSLNESADGQWAIYDVERQIITLGGDVTLRQSDNVITGGRLELDLASKVTRLSGAAQEGEEGRVRARFTVPK